MVLLPIEKVPSCISTTWYLYLMVLLPSIHPFHILGNESGFKKGIIYVTSHNFWRNKYNFTSKCINLT